MTWNQFERYCKNLIERECPDVQYRVEPQRSHIYNDGQEKRIDYHIAERRPGGKGYVVECKHYTKMRLGRKEVQQVVKYKKYSRASKAFLFISDSTDYGSTFEHEADREGVEWVVVCTTTIGKAKNRFKKFLKM